MAKNRQNSGFILLRYLLLLAISVILVLSPLFYDLFLQLTIYPVNFLVNFIYPSQIIQNYLLISDHLIELVPACIAVSAYLLLLILNLTAPMNAKTRLYSLFFSILSLLIVNILRIVIFSILFVQEYANFEMLHKFTWYFLSIVFVVGIWFASVAIFKIRQIPVYTDFKQMIGSMKRDKNDSATN